MSQHQEYVDVHTCSQVSDQTQSMMHVYAEVCYIYRSVFKLILEKQINFGVLQVCVCACVLYAS